MEAIPKDKYNFVLCTVCLIGITGLLPWNFFVTANQYWMYKFRDVNSTDTTFGNKTELQKLFTSYLTIASKAPFVVFLLVNAWINHRFGAFLRVGVSLATNIILFTVTASLVYVNTDSSQTDFLIGTLSCVVAVSVVVAFHQGGGMGVAGALPKKYMTSFLYGAALGGVFASVAQILTLLGDTTPQESALTYFLIAVALLVLTSVVFLIMVKSSFYNYYMSMQVGKKNDTKKATIWERTALKTNLNLPSYTEEKGSQQVLINSQDVESVDLKTIKQIISKIWVHALSIVTIFWITLAVFPAVSVLVVSADHVFSDKLFLPVTCFLNYNIFDILGRVIATYLPLPSERKYTLLFLCFVRVGFIPLFMLCNIPNRVHMSTVFGSDAIFAILVLSLGTTNGYLIAIAMTYGPKVVEVQYQEKAASMLALCIGVGLLLGAVSSYGLVNLL